jgi:hypothetical protein
MPPAARGGSGARTARTTAPAAAPVSPTAGRVARRPVVIAVVTIGATVVAGLAWAQLRSSGTGTAGATSVLVQPRPASTPGTAATRRPPPASGEDLPVGRDPFAGVPAPAGTAPTTSPHVSEPSLPGTAQLAPTGSAVLQPSPSGTPSATPTVTVTVPAPSGGPTYVGLYAWNGSRASFRVNARTYSVAVGTRFGPGLTFTAVVRGDPPCARVSDVKGSFTLCPGQVTALP